MSSHNKSAETAQMKNTFALLEMTGEQIGLHWLALNQSLGPVIMKYDGP